MSDDGVDFFVGLGIGILLLMAWPNTYSSGKVVDKAIAVCSNNEGVKWMRLDYGNANVICNNDARFSVSGSD